MSQSILDAARLSLKEAERLERCADWNPDDRRRGQYEIARDELLLSIAQSNLAIAEALTAPGPEECPDGEPCPATDGFWGGLNDLEDEVDEPDASAESPDRNEAPLALTPELLAGIVVANLWLGGDWV